MWARDSVVSEQSAQCHEHRNICETLRLGFCIDRLRLSHLAAFEQFCRRLVQIEIAAAKNPKHPDFSGLDVIVDGPVSSGVAARVHGFTHWIMEQQRERATILKQNCLYAEEQTAQSRAAASTSSSADAGNPRDRNSAKANAKAKKGVGKAAADDGG